VLVLQSVYFIAGRGTNVYRIVNLHPPGHPVTAGPLSNLHAAWLLSYYCLQNTSKTVRWNTSIASKQPHRLTQWTVDTRRSVLQNGVTSHWTNFLRMHYGNSTRDVIAKGRVKQIPMLFAATLFFSDVPIRSLAGVLRSCYTEAHQAKELQIPLRLTIHFRALNFSRCSQPSSRSDRKLLP
jgi:hypothetical protein